ncbi:hypothetical protein ACTOB_003063 [Actinoplanes oblitus]|uniref:FtsH ternary system domain-containing protein n=1 Tax=Actinoplanes oblitus TaxID=3040509 RepID=A0ABY8WPM3_9ACTN|nr:hypothetical protein [Actinoplanes oblitus]WIM99412.1 hypothetical protein ACTOB_003063 [Actinoplanes oblitus]
MRVRVRFRYRTETGEVEIFSVDETEGGPRAADHDTRHDRIAADVGRVVDPNPLVTREAPAVAETLPADRQQAPRETEPVRERDDRRRE